MIPHCNPWFCWYCGHTEPIKTCSYTSVSAVPAAPSCRHLYTAAVTVCCLTAASLKAHGVDYSLSAGGDSVPSEPRPAASICMYVSIWGHTHTHTHTHTQWKQLWVVKYRPVRDEIVSPPMNSGLQHIHKTLRCFIRLIILKHFFNVYHHQRQLIPKFIKY